MQDDEADGFISTRYQSADDYAKFMVLPIDPSNPDLVRITVKADGRMTHANDLGQSSKGMPAYVVSTLSQQDDGYNHFRISKQLDGSFTIQTNASNRFWAVDSADDGIIFTVADANDASAFELMPAGVSPAGAMLGQCFAVTSPGFNPSYDPTAVSGIVDWGCRTDDDCTLLSALHSVV
jgi:hypothetical protein